MSVEHFQMLCRLDPCILAYPTKNFEASCTDTGPLQGVDRVKACIMNISGPQISHSQPTCH